MASPSPSAVALTAVTAALEDAAAAPPAEETPAAQRLRRLEESLRQAQELTSNMVGMLDTFDNRLARLHESIAPIHTLTKRLTTASNNIDNVHDQLGVIIGYLDLPEVMRQSVTMDSVSVNLSLYLANMDKLEQAVTAVQRYQIAPGEKSVAALRTLYRAGLKRLEEEFRSLLDRASPALDVAASQIHDAAQAVLAAKAYESAATPGNNKTGLLLIERSALPTLVRLAEYMTAASSASNPVNADAVAAADASSTRPASMASSTSSADGALSEKARGVVFAPHASILVAVRLGFATRLLPVLLSLATEAVEGASRRRAKFPVLGAQAGKRDNGLRPQLSEPISASSSLGDEEQASGTSGSASGLRTSTDSAGTDGGGARPSLAALASLGGSGGISVGGASKALMALSKLKKAAQQTSQLTLDIARPETGNHPYIFYLRGLLVFLRSERDLMDELLPNGMTRSVFASMLALVMQDAVQRFESALLKARRAMASRDFDEFFITLDLSDCLSMQGDAFDSLCLYAGKATNDLNELQVAFRSLAADALPAFLNDIQRPLKQSTLPEDGTVHQQTSNVIFFLQKLVIYRSAVENLMRTTNTVALGPEPTGAPGRGNAVPEHPVSRLAQYIVVALGYLSSNLETNAKSYKKPALSAIFLLNNYHYVLKYLKQPAVQNMVGSVVVNEYTEQVALQKDAYQSSWKNVIEFLLEVNAGRNAAPIPSGSSVGRSQAQKIKDRFKGFNEQFSETTTAQKAYAIPDADLRESMRQAVVDLIVPLYAKFVERYAEVNFSKNPSKYILYKPAELEIQFKHLFDTSS